MRRGSRIAPFFWLYTRDERLYVNAYEMKPRVPVAGDMVFMRRAFIIFVIIRMFVIPNRKISTKNATATHFVGYSLR